MKDTMHDTTLGLKLLVGPDEVSVVKKVGVPVLVDPVIAKPTGAEKSKLDLDAKIGPDEVSVAQKDKKGVPVLVDPVVAKPTGVESANLGGKMTVGPDEVKYGKKPTKLAQTGNPVWNPPFNNWSVNQPSGPHAAGLAANANLGQHFVVDGHRVDV
jgi:hypothetical protein